MTTGAFAEFLSPMSFQYPAVITQSGWLEHAPFAAWLVEATKPDLVVELGSHWGYSFFAICQAVARLGLPTRCVAVDTWEGDEHAGMYGNEVYEFVQHTATTTYPGFTRLVRKRFDEAVHEFDDASIDLLHIDGRHLYEDALEDFTLFLPKVSDRGVVLFHDISVRERGFGVWRLWEEVSQRFPTFAFDHGNGLGVAAVGSDVPEPIRRLASLTADSADATFVRGAYRQLGQAISGTDGMRRADELEIRLHDAGARHAREITALRDKLEAALLAEDRNEAMARQIEGRQTSLLSRARVLEHDLRQARRPTARRFAGMIRSELRRLGARLLGSDVPDEAMAATLGELFDADYYRSQHPELNLSDAALFAHYLKHGWQAGESPTALFDPIWYASQNPDVVASGLQPLTHYLQHGDAEGRAPNAVLDIGWYRLHHADELAPGGNALAHFIQHGDKLGYDPSPAFFTTWYKDRYPEVRHSGRIALVDYLTGGALRGRDPHPDFSTSWYVTSNPDVSRDGVNPLVHYLTYGLDEGRASNAAGAHLCRN